MEAQPWKDLSLKNKCECEYCEKLGPSSTHHAQDHDQKLDQNFTINNKTIRIQGGTTKCARVMLKYIQEHQQDFENKNIVELGAGTGLVGLCAIHANAKHVCFTDQEPMMDILKFNVESNLEQTHQTRALFAPLFWGEDVSQVRATIGDIDVIIGSDLIFAHENNIPLVRTAAALSSFSPSTTVFYLVVIRRFTWEEKFFEAMDDIFHAQIVHQEGDIQVHKFVQKQK